jgi:signal transduction histidine kinase
MHPDHLAAFYEPNLVVLSVIIAICAAYTIVYLTERIARTQGLTMLGWLLGGSLSLGVGIWSMHFVGMLAFHLPIAVQYNRPIVGLSILPAILASGLALWITSRQTLSAAKLIGSSVLMGLGIATMHYTGMAAMRLSAEIHYNPGMVALSIGVAIGLSSVALWLTHQLQTRTVVAPFQKIGAAVLMGLAIPAMHYTGMAAACFDPVATLAKTPLTTDSSWLASLVSAVTFAILGLILLIAAETKVIDRTRELTETLDQLRQSQSQLIQTEKMSGLGQLVAGIAHEVNNPVNFIYGNLQHLSQYTQELLELLQAYQDHYPTPAPAVQALSDKIEIDFLTEDLQKLIQSMKMGTERIRQLVLSLRNFSRLDESHFKPADIHEGLDSTLLILQHRLQEKTETADIEIIKDYSQLPLIEGYPGQLNQVFMNLLANAIDALAEAAVHRKQTDLPIKPSSIWISTHQKDTQWVQIIIADNGPGMPESVAAKIFDPFFTTKPTGKGTGLGLSISYQIVTERHHGRLLVDTTPGEGTKFIVEIPIRQTVQ